MRRVKPSDTNVSKSAVNQFDLFRTTRDDYGNDYQAHFLEQYKLYVEMADRASLRRMLANSFFLTLNTAIIAAAAICYKEGLRSPQAWMVVPLVTVLMLCFVWYRLVDSYRQLNAGKYTVIGGMENHLPAAPYAAEWVVLGEAKNPKKYRPLTHIEKWVPVAFTVLYIALAVMGWTHR